MFLISSANAVLHLTMDISEHKSHILYFDNRFISIPLIEHLASRGIWSCVALRIPDLARVQRKTLIKF